MIDMNPESRPQSGEEATTEAPAKGESVVYQAEEICQQTGFEVRRQDDDSELGASFLLGVPNGRYTRWIAVYEDKARDIVSAEIVPPVVALGDYQAVLYKDTLEIEAAVRSPSPLVTNSIRLTRLPGIRNEEAGELDDDDIRRFGKGWILPFEADKDQEWSAWLGSASEKFSLFSFRSGGAITLTIGKVKTSRHDEALKFLEERSSSVLFELDLRYGVSLNLTRAPYIVRMRRTDSAGRVQARARARPREVSTEAPHLPRNSYPEKPLALYWYARSATAMPLLQYLALYQVLEYYFPVYYQRETLDRVKQELLDPRFSPQNDTHLTRLVNLMSPQGRNFGNEREQLRATVRACVSQSRLEEYLQDERRDEFFSGKQQISKVARLDLKNKNADLRDQVANRIYDIRCRIVHTKSESDDQYPELLLPFSEEAESLVFDIDLIQFLAQRVLIHRAEPLRVES